MLRSCDACFRACSLCCIRVALFAGSLLDPAMATCPVPPTALAAPCHPAVPDTPLPCTSHITLTHITHPTSQGAGTPFTTCPDAFSLLGELLFVHGGTAGLAEAVRLVRDAHARGVLAAYTRPGNNTPPQTPSAGMNSTSSQAGSTATSGGGGNQPGAASGDGGFVGSPGGSSAGSSPRRSTETNASAAPGGSSSTGPNSPEARSPQQQAQGGVAAAAGEGMEPGACVVVAGESRIAAIVVLLAWLGELRDAARWVLG